eukprot:scaffold327946_cov63-Tisochrysis_lutea.AAC.1
MRNTTRATAHTPPLPLRSGVSVADRAHAHGPWWAQSQGPSASALSTQYCRSTATAGKLG